MKTYKILLVLIAIVILTGCGSNYSKLEDELTIKGTSYYEEYIKGKVQGVSAHKISLEALAKVNVDVSNFEKEECDMESYILIDVTTDEYKTKNYLTCKKYKTKN